MSEQIRQMLMLLDECLESWKSAKSEIENSLPDYEEPHPSIGIKIDELDIGIKSILEAAGTFDPDNQTASAILSLTNDIQSMTEFLNAIKNGSDAITIFFNTAKDEGREVTVSDDQNILSDGATQLNLGAQIVQIKENAGHFIKLVTRLREFITSREIADLSGRARQFHDLAQEIKEILSSAEGAESEIKEVLDEIISTNDKSSQFLQNIEQTKQTADEAKEQAQAAINETDAKIAQVRELSTQAETLRTQVDQYQAQFDAFQETLAEREKEFEEFVKSNQEAKEKNIERENRIDEIIEKSNQMLVGATNVGLSKAFNDASDRYGKESGKAIWAFYGSIVILIISAIPIAWYLLTSTHEQNGVTLAGTAARAALLLPAILLTTFASHRFWALFQLHREYAFKAAIAMSIDGFKQQAPRFEEEITGAAFNELVKKPDYSTPKEAMKSPNPILDAIFNNIKTPGRSKNE